MGSDDISSDPRARSLARSRGFFSALEDFFFRDGDGDADDEDEYDEAQEESRE